MSRAVIFDLDGTLIDSAPDIHAAANKVVERHGMDPFTLTEARGFVGHGAAIFIDRCLTARGREGDGALRATMLSEFLELYEGAVHLTELYPGVAHCLTTMTAKGLRLGICTNKPERPTMAVLDHLGIMGTFDAVVGGDTTPVRKPDPRPLRETIARMGTTQVVFVGDSEVDAETADRANIPFALYSEGYRKTPIAQLPHAAVFDDFVELPQILDRLWL